MKIFRILLNLGKIFSPTLSCLTDSFFFFPSPSHTTNSRNHCAAGDLPAALVGVLLIHSELLQSLNFCWPTLLPFQPSWTNLTWLVGHSQTSCRSPADQHIHRKFGMFERCWDFGTNLFGCAFLAADVGWAVYTGPLHLARAKLSVPLLQKRKNMAIDVPLAMIIITENQRWEKLGSLTLSPAPGILEGQSLALQTMSSSHKMMFSCCFKVNWRASGRLSCWHWHVFLWFSVLRSLESQSLLKY